MATSKFLSDISIDGDLSVTGSYGLSASDIPSLAASKITSGTLGTARIPNLAASKITSGTFATARIADNAITAAKLNVSGNGTTSQFLRSDGDGSFTWATPASQAVDWSEIQGDQSSILLSNFTNDSGFVTSSGVTSVGGTGTKNGLTLTGTVTSTGNLTLGGTLSISNADWSGTDLSIANGGTGASSASAARTNLGLGTAATSASTDFVAVSGDTMTGSLNIGDGSANTLLIIKKSDTNVSDHIQFYNATTRVGEIGCHDDTWLRINQTTNKNIYTPRYIRADNGFFVDGTSKGINGSGNFIGGTITGASDANVSNWDTAYSWGDHSSAGYSTATGVADNANNYSLPAGSSSVRGGFKIGYSENGKNYPVEVSSEKMFVNVPWTDNNTTYSVGDGGLTQKNFTTTLKNKLDGIAASANNYSLPAGSSSVRGGFKIGYSENGKNYPVEVSSEKMYVNVPWTDNNTTYSAFAGEESGLVPNGSSVNENYFLDGSGGWSIPPDNNTTYSAGSGLDLSGTTFSVESNLAGDVHTIGRDANDKYVINTQNHAWYLDGVLDMRLSNAGTLDVDGDVVAYSTVTSSDRKLKTDIETLEDASEKVSALRGVSFTWSHGKKTGKKDIGLIAQEVEEVVPEIVGESELLDGTMAKHVDYPKVVALLIEAHKEQQEVISQLEERIIDLENRL